MTNIYKYLRIEWKKSIIVLFLIFIVTVSQVATSYVQVWSFNRLLRNDFLGFLKLELLGISLWIVLLSFNHRLVISKEKLITQISNSIRERYIRAIASKPYNEFIEYDANYYATGLSNDIALIETNGFVSFLNMIETTFLMSFSLIALFSFHYSIAILTVVLTIVVTFLPRFFNKKSQVITEKYLSSTNQYLSKNLNILEGVNILFSLNRIELLTKLITQNNHKFKDEKILYVKQNGVINLFIALISITSQMSLSVYTGYIATEGLITLGVLGSVGNIAANVFNSLTVFSRDMISINSVSSILQKFEIDEIVKNDSKISNQFTSLEISNLSLDFGEKEIFKDVNLSFQKGRKYAITGESGSGKTTLLNLILGRVKNYEGSIYLNNIDIKELSNRDISQLIGYAQQDKHLFNDTIYNNITLWGSIDDSNLLSVLELVNLNNLNTTLNAVKANLSDGEKQRLILARLILQGNDVFFIDEGTSNLDKKNADEIVRKLLELKETTIVMITHHLSDEFENEFDQVVNLS
ncbi:ABC transporter ATP-binding protein [Erysipelothrix urinaevulpis]|uniref:ATP-binding cassette domain-containing protein n=1 Tax=Erysipelothrix urinaevulpis TaxID=2683717 RepID=UPI00135A1FB7|nr:ABC transporter ATP-binding protein [Erysipelothrix urinaevulpis]